MKHLTARPDVSPLPEPYRSIVGQGAWPRTRTSGRRGSTTCSRPTTPRGRRRPVHRRRQGAPAAARAAARPPTAAERTTRSCGSRPRSRSSTSAPRPGRRDRRSNQRLRAAFRTARPASAAAHRGAAGPPGPQRVAAPPATALRPRPPSRPPLPRGAGAGGRACVVDALAAPARRLARQSGRDRAGGRPAPRSPSSSLSCSA